MAKKPTKTKEVAVKATSSHTVETSNGTVYTVRFGDKVKLGSKVDAKS
tara:strand:+ start:8228 stop:8371 length:144 start_codon:yes stop_codon:yes gene_type:complete